MLSQGPGLARNEAEASVASRSAVERHSRPKPSRPPRIRTPKSWPDPSGVATPRNTKCASCVKRRRLPPSVAASARFSVAKACTPRQLATRTSSGIREALTPQKRGPKSKRHPLADEMEKLQRQNARLNEELRKAHIIIDVQKKVAALLGHPLADEDPERES